MPQHDVSRCSARVVIDGAGESFVMICAPAEARPAFRLGVRERNGRERSEDGADDHISQKRESKVFEFLEGVARSVSPEGESSMSLRNGRFQ